MKRPGNSSHTSAENVLCESHRRVVAGAENVRLHPPTGAHFERPARAGKLRIGRQRRLEMARNFDLRNERDVPRLRVGDEVADLLLRVEERAVRPAVAFVAVAGPRRFLADGADFRQARVFFDFKAPALVIGEVKLERVEFVAAPSHPRTS